MNAREEQYDTLLRDLDRLLDRLMVDADQIRVRLATDLADAGEGDAKPPRNPPDAGPEPSPEVIARLVEASPNITSGLIERLQKVARQCILALDTTDDESARSWFCTVAATAVMAQWTGESTDQLEHDLREWAGEYDRAREANLDAALRDRPGQGDAALDRALVAAPEAHGDGRPGPYDEGGLPVHLPMGVTADGQGPTESETPHHRECWCNDPDCMWTVALAAERADAILAANPTTRRRNQRRSVMTTTPAGEVPEAVERQWVNAMDELAAIGDGERYALRDPSKTPAGHAAQVRREVQRVLQRLPSGTALSGQEGPHA